MLPVAGFLDFCRQNKLLLPGQRVLAAVSGGKDSVLMAHLLKAANIGFGIAHVNFGLRGRESDRDERFVEELAASMDVPFLHTFFNTHDFAEQNGLSVQMAARDLRYAWFEKIRAANGFALVATAHHLGDMAETMLLNLVRGTGLGGLHGIAVKKDHLIRPMLYLTAEQINGLVLSHKIAWVEDSSNARTDYARNKIRHEVMPRLKELNPGLEHTFRRNAARLAQSEEVLHDTVIRLSDALLKHQPDGSVHIGKTDFFGLKPLELLAFELLKPFGFSEAVTAGIIRSRDVQPGKQFFSAQHRLVFDRYELIIQKLHSPVTGTVAFCEEDHAVQFAGYIIRKNTDKNELVAGNHFAADAGKLIYPLTVRAWQNGDRFYPTGLQGSKKLSDYFTDRKISRVKKASVPLLVNGNGDIIWVCGYRGDRRYAAGPGSRKVVIFERSEHPL